MTKPYTKYIEPKTRFMLWAKTAGRCEICNEVVWKDWLTKTGGNFGEIAHIIGNRLDVKGREKAKLSSEYCNQIENLMLLCPTHHHLIDYEEPENYPEAKLRRIKKRHEERIERVTEIKNDRFSHIIKYGANIDKHNAIISFNDAQVAMVSNGWFPASDNPIKLGIDNSISKDNEQEYWAIQQKELTNQFAKNVNPFIKDGGENHFSIFALAPIPLLIKLGSMLTEINRIEVYQLHRRPHQNWNWQKGPRDFEYIVQKPQKIFDTVALDISLSASIVDKRIFETLCSEKTSIWKISIESPSNDFLKSRKQLQDFGIVFNRLLDNIKAIHREDSVIHIFPAVPVSVAVEIGRVRQSKADLPFIIYDQNRNRGGFIETIRIG